MRGTGYDPPSSSIDRPYKPAKISFSFSNGGITFYIVSASRRDEVGNWFIASSEPQTTCSAVWALENIRGLDNVKLI